MLLAIAAFVVGTAPGFATVFGARLGQDSPVRIERHFGAGMQTVRKTDPFDDGWDWWRWPVAKGDLQVQWEPAYPVSSRRITSLCLTSSFGPVRRGSDIITPSRKLCGWLATIRVGIPLRDCISNLESLFGKPTHQFGEYIWTSGRFELDVSGRKGRLDEMWVRFTG